MCYIFLFNEVNSLCYMIGQFFADFLKITDFHFIFSFPVSNQYEWSPKVWVRVFFGFHYFYLCFL